MTQLHSATTQASPPPSDPQASGIDADLVAVDAALAAFFAERSAAAADFGHSYRRLWESARDAAEGGKRLRPRFLLSAFHGLGAPDDRREDAIRTAVAFELLHTAFLLHDDLIDGDTVRRGRPNVAGEFSADALFRGADAPLAAAWGESAALLAGDLLLHAASDQLARLDAPAGVRSRLLDALDRAVFVTAAGELADVGLATGMTARGIPDVLAMTEQKTAAYSVSGPLAAGALLAGASGALLDALTHYGRLVGVAFQLGDDLLGVFGRPAVTGKSIVSDLREGKETSLIAFARGTAVWPELGAALGRRDLDAVTAVRLASLLQECGARGFVERLLAENVEAAIAAVGSPAVPDALASELTAVARSCVGRVV